MNEGYPLNKLEEVIGYCFKDKVILKQAMTHSSYSNEQKINRLGDYERLEFLGDAVLELVTSEFLFRENMQMPEGQMTKLRSSYVCEPALAYCAREMELDRYILLGKGEETTGGRNRDSIISDVMEALIGAIYLDGGFANAKEHIYKFILSDLEYKQLFYDSKTILQEIIQGMTGTTLSYDIVDEKGPEHDKIFIVKAIINGKVISEGFGRTKKAAEQKAAYEAILILKKNKRSM